MILKMSRAAVSLWIRRGIFNICAFCCLADFTQLFALSSAVSLTFSLLVAGPRRTLARLCLLTRHACSGFPQLWDDQGKKRKKKKVTHSDFGHLLILRGNSEWVTIKLKQLIFEKEKRCKIKHLISHVGQVSFHCVGILPICVVFRLYFTNPVKEQDSRSVKVGSKTLGCSCPQHIFKQNLNGF